MKAVILVAGVSRRLAPTTMEVPKCLVEVGDRRILDYQLGALQAVGVNDLTVVVGYRREQVMEAIKSDYPSFNLTTIINHHFFDTNTAYSLSLAKDAFAGHDFLYFNGDVVFHPALVERLLQSPLPNPLAIEVKPCGDEEVKVRADDAGRVLEISKQVDLSAALGEFLGVARFDADFTSAFAEDLDQVIADGERDAYFELSLERLARDHTLSVVDVTDLPSIEIDFVEDLERAQNLFGR